MNIKIFKVLYWLAEIEENAIQNKGNIPKYKPQKNLTHWYTDLPHMNPKLPHANWRKLVSMDTMYL